MKRKIFYSWQSDLPGATNRNFILQALEKTVKKIVNDDTIEIEAVVDRDTLGLPGSPEITSAIFNKISNSDIFVADISIINSAQEGRKTPNPNVLIELGYALNSLGFERVIFIFNLAYGKLEQLPFDLRMRRIMTYNSTKESTSRAEERKCLERQLNDALMTAFYHLPEIVEPMSQSPVITAIENNSPTRHLILRKELKLMLDNMVAVAPAINHGKGSYENLVQSLAKTPPFVTDFLTIAESAILLKDELVLFEIFRWFGQLFLKYRRAEDYMGGSFDSDYDFYRFTGHELLVSMVSLLLKEQAFDLIKKLLDEPIPLNYLREENGPGEVYFYYASEWVYAMRDEDEKQGKLSVHGYILKERHTTGSLGIAIPIKDLASADYFLYLYEKIAMKKKTGVSYTWRPWTIAYVAEPPFFLKRAERANAALALAQLFNLTTIEELRADVETYTLKVRNFFPNRALDLFLRAFDFKKIGTL